MPSPADIHASLGSILGLAAVGYLLGSLAFGYWIAKSRGADIFAEGSKSSGATNVGRVVGRGIGKLVFVLDVLKGVAAAGWPLLLHPTQPALGLAGLAGALVGHCFSCFTRFRGGKGVATATGGFLVIMPVPALIGGAVWIAVFLVSRYVSLASLAAAFAVPAANLLLGGPRLLTIGSLVVAVFIGFRHRANIARLLAGTELKRPRRTEASS